jgi:hypothetical protein
MTKKQRAETMTERMVIITAIAAADNTACLSLESGINTILTSLNATLKGA